MTYGLEIVVFSSEFPDIRLEINMPEVNREKVAAENPALDVVFKNYDQVMGFVVEVEATKET